MSPILIDDRIGSKHLAAIIKRQDERAEVELTRLEYGDVAISVNGPDDEPMLVGVEVKKIEDLLNSISTGRLVTHQLPGLLSMYDLCFLLIQGVWRRDPENGVLQILRGKYQTAKTGPRRWMWREVNSFLTSMYLQTLFMGKPVCVLHSTNNKDTAQIVLSLESWGRKKWTEHKSLRAVNQLKNIKLSGVKRKKVDGVGRFMPPSLIEKVAAQFDCIGPTRAISVAKHFGSLEQMFNADEKEWKQIEGIGKLTAGRVVNAIRGR